MTQNERRHKRFKLDLMEVNGKMMLAQKVEIIDISLGGIALRTDRKLNVGKEYLIRLDNMAKHIDVKGVIVRCELDKIEERYDGERVATYTAGMMFKDIAEDNIADFLSSIDKHQKEEVQVMVDGRSTVRFYITTPWQKTLSYPSQFKVKKISLCGMLIQTEEALGIESVVPMGLSLKADKPVNFIGRVASNRMAGGKEPYYETGVEFTDLTDEGKTLLKAFVDYLAEMEIKAGRKANI